MAIFSRIADILKANINDMIDKAEDPVKMVKQLIIEMEQQVDDATQALGQAMGSQKVADWNDKAKLALKNGNEELARKALDVKVGLDEQVVQLRASYDAITEQVNKLKDQVQTLRVKLDEARARQSVLAARAKMAEASKTAAKSVNSSSLDSAFAKLDQLEAKIVAQESVAEAYTDINVGEVDAETAFADMAHNAAIDSELDRLKAELGL